MYNQPLPSTAFHNLSFATPMELNLPSVPRYGHGARSPQFDSPAFNNDPFWKPSWLYGGPANPTSHMPTTPFPSQTQPYHFSPYHGSNSYTPQPRPYYSRTSFAPSSVRLHNTIQSDINHTDTGLDVSPFIVPSQHRDTHGDIRPAHHTGSDVQRGIASPHPNSSCEFIIELR